MLKTSELDDVIRIDSSRALAGRGLYWTTAYLVDGLLIDTGCAHTAKELADLLEKENLASIVNTHSHEDHIGANGLLQKHRKDVRILAHPLALPVLARPRETQPLHPYRRIFWGWPEPSIGQPVRDGELIETRNYQFQIIYTPGHAPDHICLYEQKHGWLFTGDLFAGGRDRASRLDCDIWQVIASLKKVAGLPLTRLYPGCARIRDNPKEELAAKFRFLEETGEKVQELYKQGLSKKSIARTVFGGSMLIEFVTLGDFTRRNLVHSYLAHEDRSNNLRPV